MFGRNKVIVFGRNCCAKRKHKTQAIINNKTTNQQHTRFGLKIESPKHTVLEHIHRTFAIEKQVWKVQPNNKTGNENKSNSTTNMIITRKLNL